MNKRFLRGLIPLLLGLLACQPMVVIGWTEFFFVFILIAILIGPPLYKLIRGIEIKSAQNDKDEKGNPE